MISAIATSHCGIVLANFDSTFTGVYCHSDGQPSLVGKELKKNYKNHKKIKKLIDGGDIMTLTTLIKNEYINGRHFKDELNEPTYYQYCGESWESVKPQQFKTIEECFIHFADYWCEYVYVWDQQWKCFNLTTQQYEII